MLNPAAGADLRRIESEPLLSALAETGYLSHFSIGLSNLHVRLAQNIKNG
jgi:hypothetical protein